MKTRFYLLQAGFLFMFLSLWSTDTKAQCFAAYTTSSYFCDLDSIYLTALPGGGTEPYGFDWDTGDTTQTIIIPRINGDFVVTITDANGCVFVMNCHVKPGPLVLYYPFNQNGCEGDTVTLFLEWYRDSIPGATYLWSTGETTPTIEITDDITWSATITDPNTGCEFVVEPNLFEFHHVNDPEIVGGTFICDGQTITLSYTGGPFGNTIWYTVGVWDGVYAETFEVTGPGTYVLWANSVDANYCWKQDTIVITEGEIDPPLLAGPPELCTGQEGTITVTNSSLYMDFDWSNGQSTSSIQVFQPGTYSVTVTDSGGCTATTSLSVGDGSDFDGTIAADATTCGESNGSLDLSVSPLAPYTFQWSNGSTVEDPEDLAAGSYTVTITAPNGCTQVETALLPDHPILITINETITPNTSCDDGNGSISITLSPAGDYALQWSNGATTETITGLNPGPYSVTVSLGENCTATETYTVGNETDAPTIALVETPSECGQSNGAIDLQINGGNGPFTILWSDGSSTEDLTNLVAGTYSVTVTGTDGCAENESVLVEDQSIDLLITAEVIPVTSCSATNGSIDLAVSPAGQYSFVWSNGATTEDLSNLSDGIYTVEILSGENCTDTASFVVGHEGTQTDIAALIEPSSSCADPNGSVNLTISPAGSYSFLWSNGANTEDLDNLPAGTYSVTITDSEDCTSFGSYVVESDLVMPVLTLNVQSATCSTDNGTINLSIEPASGNTILWSNGATTEDLNALAPGEYAVTVTNANGCTASDTVTIENIAGTFSISAQVTENTACALGNGAIDLSVQPAGTYAFLWSNGSTTEDNLGLAPGNYSVSVTDTLGCTTIQSFIVGNNSPGPDILGVIADATCGQNNGAIFLSVTPPGTYTFQWSTGATTENISDVGPGEYIVSTTDAAGCTTIDTFNVGSVNSNLVVTSTVNHNTSCTLSNASINLDIAPAGAYTFQWSTGQTTEDLPFVIAGTYSVTITDTLQCSAVYSFDVNDIFVPVSVSVQVTDAFCGQPNGAIDLAILPATGNTFLWSTGATTEDVVNLPEGDYSVTIIGAGGCTLDTTITIHNEGLEVGITGVVTPDSDCNTANGAIDISLSETGEFVIAWSNGVTSYDLTGLSAGQYFVTVSDVNGCASTATFVVEDSTTTPVITGIVLPATCGQKNGRITLDVVPATGAAFLWSDGSVSQNLQDISAATYTVTVTGAGGCTGTASFIVPQNGNAFTISGIQTANTSCLNPDGSIDLNITPEGQYDLIWSNGAMTEDLSGLSAGTYSITVTDAGDCSDTATFMITSDTPSPEANLIAIDGDCGENNGAIDLNVTPPDGNTFFWSDGSTTEDLTNLAAGIYSVTITHQSGCIWTGSAAVTVPAMPSVDLGADLVVDAGQMVTLRAEVNVPLSALDTTIWLPDAIFSCAEKVCLEQSFVPEEETLVTFMVFDTNGCMAEESVMITIRSVIDPDVYIPNVFSPNDDSVNDHFTVFANPDVQEVVDLRIFDRWGEFVFQNQHFPPNEPEFGWDGSYRTEIMNPQVFVFWAKVLFKDGTEKFYKGDVTLVR